MSRIFITGGSGFIGTNLVQSLLDEGHQVVNYDIKPPRNSEHQSVWIEGDIRDAEKLTSQTRQFKPDKFVHLAARTDLDGKDLADYSANTDGVRNVIEVVSATKSIERVLFASSRLVCKIGYTPQADDDYCPTTYYGESKVIGERNVRENAARLPTWVILRPTSIWGPWFDTPYKDFFLSILHSHYVHPRGWRIYKSFGYVGNSVYMIGRVITAAPQLIQGKTMYIADYPPIEVKHWADQIAKQNGSQAPREVSLFVLKLIALGGDLLKLLGWSPPPLTSFRLNNIKTKMIYNTDEIEQLCCRLPYSVEDGIHNTLVWLKSQKK